MVLTAALFAALLVIGLLDTRGMSPFDAFAHALSTMPTGGFSTRTTSLAGFDAATQWVIVLFMVLAGMNFALLYRAFVRREPRAAAHDEEMRVYLAVLALGAIVVVAEIWDEGFASGERAIRDGVFQATSLMTTTGFATFDFAGWPTLALMTLVALMFVVHRPLQVESSITRPSTKPAVSAPNALPIPPSTTVVKTRKRT